MSKVAPLVLLLCAFCGAQSNTEYPVTVHVTSSQWTAMPSGIGPAPVQRLNVIIDGKKYELAAEVKGRFAVLSLGDYKARLIEDVHKNTYESTQTYEFQFSDKKTRKFMVFGQSE
jgi:hypothetical protein